VTLWGINILLDVGKGGGSIGGGGGGGIAGNGGRVDGSGGRFKGNCCSSFGGVGGGGKNGFCVFCGFGGTVEEFNCLIPGGIGNDCLAGEAFGMDNNFTFFVIAACIACSGVSTTIKITIRIMLNN